MDEGRLTDSHGRTVDFRNAVIIMTSNIGSQFILEKGGSAGWEEVESFVRGELHHHFRPEFLNRVDDTILFRPLGVEDLKAIVELQLERVRNLAVEVGVFLDVSPEAKDVIARVGHDPAFGARPLKRAIQRLVQDPLALKLLEVEIGDGTRVRVVPGAETDALDFEVLSGEGTQS
jgi:ATP-dependent Clp protease ATP-binding subunit ClpB